MQAAGASAQALLACVRACVYRRVTVMEMRRMEAAAPRERAGGVHARSDAADRWLRVRVESAGDLHVGLRSRVRCFFHLKEPAVTSQISSSGQVSQVWSSCVLTETLRVQGHFQVHGSGRPSPSV